MDVDPAFESGIWFRHIPGGGDVDYVPDDPADGRWQRGEVVEALYFGESADTVWAEWYRALAEFGIPPHQQMPRDLWRWEISLSRVANLSDARRLARVGLGPPIPSRADWPPFQAVGEALYADGWPAIIAPSSARTGGQVLCVFRVERRVPGLVPIPPPERVDLPPAPPRGMRT